MGHGLGIRFMAKPHHQAAHLGVTHRRALAGKIGQEQRR